MSASGFRTSTTEQFDDPQRVTSGADALVQDARDTVRQNLVSDKDKKVLQGATDAAGAAGVPTPYR